MTMSVQALLDQATAILPFSRDEIITKGVAAGVSERMIELKRSANKMQSRYGSKTDLERMIQREGVSPNDHTLYTDLLEWRAIDHELAELMHILEVM